MKTCASSSVSEVEQKSDLVLEDLEQDEELKKVEAEVKEQSQRVSLSFTPGDAASAGHLGLPATPSPWKPLWLFLQTEDAETKTDQRTPTTRKEAEAHPEQRLVSELDQNLEQEHPQTITGRQADH